MKNSPQRLPAAVESRRQQFEQVLSEIKLLPSSYCVPMKVLEMKRRGIAGAAEFAGVIAADGALVVKVLALANSAAFAPATPITRLSAAISMIGLKNLLPLIFGLSFAGIFNRLSLPLDEQTPLWKASLLKAVTARELTRSLPCPAWNAEQREAACEEAFVAGLLQDVSLPIFYAADRAAWPEYVAVLDQPDPLRAEREGRSYGIVHEEASARCIQMLELPEVFVNIARTHHTPLKALGPEGTTRAMALDAAASLPHRVWSLSPKILSSLSIRLQQSGGFPLETVKGLVRGVVDAFTQTSAIFAEPEDANVSFKQFLQSLSTEVVTCLQSSISHSTSEINSLRERERKIRAELISLQEKAAMAERDPLTKALTRAAFLNRLAKLLALAQDNQVECAVGFIDLDNFKRLNDTHGHGAGDAALVHLVATLGDLLRGRGIIGRIGGDEFCFAIVARDGNLEADVTAFKARAANMSLLHGQTQLEISASVGIVSVGIPETRDAPERIIKEADVLMYQAKRLGKGRAEVGRLPQAPLMNMPRPNAA